MKKSACSVLRLQGISFVIAFLISVCCTLSGCSSSIPPTLVLAWIGPGGRVSTLESNMLYSTSNGPVFQNRKDDHAIGATVGIGPTIAYNKKSTWMLMWANGAELQYRIGIGGLPRIAPGGIAWEQNFYSGKLSVSPGGSPALAYGNDRWVVVFRQSGQLHVVRTQSQSNTEWETPRDIMVSNIPALTDEDPALAFGIVNGQGTFVLVYTQPDFSVVAVTSSDGLIWSSPVPIRSMTLKAPALCENDGIFYTLLAGGSGGSEASGTSHIIYKSRDGISWSEVGRYGRTALSGTGPGMAYGVFDGAGKMIVTEQIGGALGLGAIFTGISIRIGTPNGPFNNPTSFSFTENQPVVGSGIESVGNTGARTAVAFGGIPPVKENLWAGVNNGDIFDEPDDKIDKMLTEMAKADLRVVRIIVDLRLEMDEDGNPLPYGVYNDLLLEQIDNFMVKAKRKGILLLIAFDLHNFIGGHPIPVDEEFYGWRNCKTPINIYQRSLTEGAQPVYDPYYSRGLGGDYLTNPVAKALYRLRVNHILNHINPHFGKPWKDINDVIWAWALQSEPEYLPQGTNVEYLRSWLSEMATFVRSIDPDTYIALGTKSYDESIADIEDYDIYTIHEYSSGIQQIRDELSNRGKLLLEEEFYAYRYNGPGHSISPVSKLIFETTMEECRKNNIPCMFWEYGYNLNYDSYSDIDDIWHANGIGNDNANIVDDGVFWGAKVFPGAKKIWQTSWDWLNVGRKWKVHDMVNDLCSQTNADCEQSKPIMFLDTFSADQPIDLSTYRVFDEGSPDVCRSADRYLRIEAGLRQDLWGGDQPKRGAPMVLYPVPQENYRVETFVSADPIDAPSQPLNTQIGLFIFQDNDNWIFFGLTHDEYSDRYNVEDGLTVTLTEHNRSHIAKEIPITEDFVFLKIERWLDRWYFFWKLQHAETWHFLTTVKAGFTDHEVGMGVKTLDISHNSNQANANFDFFLVDTITNKYSPIGDTTPPTGRISLPLSNSIQGLNILLSADVRDNQSGVDFVEFNIFDSANNPISSAESRLPERDGSFKANWNSRGYNGQTISVGATVWDKNGNFTDLERVRDVLLDHDAPTVTMIYPPPLPSETWINGSSITLSAHATDNAAGVQEVFFRAEYMNVDGDRVNEEIGTDSIPDANGNYTVIWYVSNIPDQRQDPDMPNLYVIAEATDRVGNIGSNWSLLYGFDREPPQVSFVSPATNLRVQGGILPIEVEATDNLGVLNRVNHLTVTASYREHGQNIPTDHRLADLSDVNSWSGNLELSALPEQTVTLIAEAEDDASNWQRYIRRTIEIDRSGPIVTLSGHSPDPFYANGSNEINFSYQVSEACQILISISDTWYQTATELSFNTVNTNPQVARWNGKDKNGNLLPSGQYMYTFSATDALGNITTSSGGAFSLVVDTTSPIVKVSVAPIYRFQDSKPLEIQYTINENCRVEIEFSDSNNIIVNYIIGRGTLPAGRYVVEWYGTDSNNNKVPNPASYQIKVRVTDLADNGGEDTATVTVTP